MSEELAWFAGLYEGEGTFTCQLRSKVHTGAGSTLAICIQMVDEDIIRRCHDFWGFGTVTCYLSKKANHQDLWRWNVYKESEILTVLTGVMPYLGQRRRKQIQDVFAKRFASMPN